MNGAGIGIGIAGWGTAGRLMANAVRRDPRFRLAAVADTDRGARDNAARATGARAVRDAAELSALPDIAAVYLATPTRHHAQGVAAVTANGRHVICEKPLAPTVEEALTAVSAARRAGVILLVGPTHAVDAPVRALRQLVDDGLLGDLVSVESSCHTDWCHRSRKPDDFDRALGNGLLLRQGAHQFDVLRLVCGGLAKMVTGAVFDGDLGYNATVTFASGTHASAYYSGAGGVDTRLLSWGIGETATVDIAPSAPLTSYFVLPGSQASTPSPAPVFGRTVATFTGGGAQITPRGLLVVRPDGAEEIDVTGEPSGWAAALEQLYRAMGGSAPSAYSGEWAVATLELCLAVHTSATSGTTTALHHQTRLPIPDVQETP